MQGQKITLNGHQLKQALSLLDEDDEHLLTEIEIKYHSRQVSDKGDDMPAGYWARYADYHEEGWFGPLVAEPNAVITHAANGSENQSGRGSALGG